MSAGIIELSPKRQQYDSIYSAGTQRPKAVPIWSYFGQDALDYNRTKIGRIRFLTYFGLAMSGMHLAFRSIEKIS